MTENEFLDEVPKIVRDWLADHGIVLCGAKQCTRPAAVKRVGLCDKHFRRKLHGHPVNEKSIYEKSADDRFWPKVLKLSNDECWLWQGKPDYWGYGRFAPGAKSNIQEVRAHRFSYALHYGNNISDECVLHTCDVRLCVNPKHLFLGDREDNARDKVNKGRQCRGESRPLSKLTDQVVRDIRKSSEKTSVLARKLNVSQSAVSMARNYATWKHI